MKYYDGDSFIAVTPLDPLSQEDADKQARLAEKRARAIAFLGPKYCLHNARPPGYTPPATPLLLLRRK